MLAGYGKTVNLLNLKGRTVYVRQTYPSQYTWYQFKIAKSVEDKDTENDRFLAI